MGIDKRVFSQGISRILTPETGQHKVFEIRLNTGKRIKVKTI